VKSLIDIGISSTMFNESLFLERTHIRRTAVRSPDLPFTVSTHFNPCNYMDYASFTDSKGMENWVGLVRWPIADTLPIDQA